MRRRLIEDLGSLPSPWRDLVVFPEGLFICVLIYHQLRSGLPLALLFLFLQGLPG